MVRKTRRVGCALLVLLLSAHAIDTTRKIEARLGHQKLRAWGRRSADDGRKGEDVSSEPLQDDFPGPEDQDQLLVDERPNVAAALLEHGSEARLNKPTGLKHVPLPRHPHGMRRVASRHEAILAQLSEGDQAQGNLHEALGAVSDVGADVLLLQGRFRFMVNKFKLVGINLSEFRRRSQRGGIGDPGIRGSAFWAQPASHPDLIIVFLWHEPGRSTSQ